VHRQFLMTTHHEAVGPPRWALRIKSDFAPPGQQNTDHIPGLNPSEGCPNAVMNTPAERNVSARHLPG